jgi:hypothetical protein
VGGEYQAVPVLLRVPDLEVAVGADAGEARPIGAERDAVDPTGVALAGPLRYAGVGVPDPDDLVGRGGGQTPAIGAERQPGNGHLTRNKSIPPRASRALPDRDAPALVSRREPVAPGAKRQCSDGTGRVGQRRQFRGRLDVPEPDPGTATGRHNSSIGAICDRSETTRLLALQDWPWPPGRGIPEADRAIDPIRRELASVGPECHREHRAGVPPEGRTLQACSGVPEPNGRVGTGCGEHIPARRKGDAADALVMALW